MKTLTIRGIDDEISEKYKKMAEEQGKSVNQFVLEVLKERVGLKKAKKHTAEHHDLDHLFGIWSEEEHKAIQKKIDSERKIDKELWG